MDKVKNINWWSLLKEFVWPHLGTIILYSIIFITIGIILATVYNIILWRKKIYRREPKYYNWGVKLYIPLSIGVFLYFAFHLAIIVSAKSILKKEEPRIVAEIYERSLAHIFENPGKRKAFILNLQQTAAEMQKDSKTMGINLNRYVKSKNTGFNLVDNGKNKLTSFLLDRYKNDIYSASLYGTLMAAGKGHVSPEQLSYDEFNALVKTLLALDTEDIEKQVKTKLTTEIHEIITNQISALIKSTIILLVVILLLPLVEFFIYNWFRKQKQLKENELFNSIEANVPNDENQY